jgi:hypothetical protein
VTPQDTRSSRAVFETFNIVIFEYILCFYLLPVDV